MARLLHTADWQVGKLFGQFDPEDKHALSEARVAVVERLAGLAAEHRVDAVLVAGDVFDFQSVGERTLRRTFEALRGFAGPWLLLPGNHDSAEAESVWTRARRMRLGTANVHLCVEAAPVLLAEPRIAVLPAPLVQRHSHVDLTAWFDAAETPDGWVRVGLAHGCVEGILHADIDSPNPVAADRAARARLDYLALGDWHGARRIDARTWYAGTPEPDRFHSNDAGRALLVEIDAPGAAPRVTSLPTARHRWRSLSARLTVSTDLDVLLRELRHVERGDVVQLEVEGEIDLAARAVLDSTLAEARARVCALREDLSGLRLAPTAEDLEALAADGYLASAIGQLRREQQSASPDEARRAGDALALLATVLAGRRTGA